MTLYNYGLVDVTYTQTDAFKNYFHFLLQYDITLYNGVQMV